MTLPRNFDTESNKTGIKQLTEKLSHSANQCVTFLESKLQDDGSYGDAKDIACYFKSPLMFLAANKPQEASKVLTYIRKSCMSPAGDFYTSDKCKSCNPAYIEYWSYTNGWIVRAANQLRISDISEPGFDYLAQYYLGDNLGVATNNITHEPKLTDVLTVAHHGLINLEFDKLDRALSLADYLCQAINKQPNLKEGFFLRFDKNGSYIKEFTVEAAPFYFVSTSKPNQLHFMIGFPAAFLAIIYQKTNNPKFLTAAKAYLDFSLSCHENVFECNFSHKLAWAASLIYECTGDEKYLTAIEKITDHFIKQQKDGMWFLPDITSAYDQSAEIACWFLDIVKKLNRL